MITILNLTVHEYGQAVRQTSMVKVPYNLGNMPINSQHIIIVKSIP
jgi:hypothetical protein